MRCKVDLRSSETVCILDWRFVTYDSGYPLGSTFKSQAVFFVECLSYEYGTEMLPRNVGNYQTMMRNSPEERMPYLGYISRTHISIRYRVSLRSNVSVTSHCN